MGEAGYWTCKKKRKLERKQERAKKQEGNAGTSSTKERESHTDIQTDEKESRREGQSAARMQRQASALRERATESRMARELDAVRK